MLKRYSRQRVQKNLAQWSDWMDTVSKQYRIPSACVRAVLEREMTEIDWMDPVADAIVGFYWFRYRLRRGLCKIGLLKSPLPVLNRGPLGKRDSSTGFGQIFAYVAINAANYGVERGLTTYGELDLPEGGVRPDDPEALCTMWHRLRRDTRYNIALSALNLVSAAEEMNGHTDFAAYTPEEFQLAFTRYNANVRHITRYGTAVYDLYLRQSRSTNGNTGGN